MKELKYDAMIAIHGYDPEGMDGGRGPEEVWRDRLSEGQESAQMLEEFGADVVFAISGGGDYGGKTEAEVIEEYASREFPGIVENYDIILEDDSEDTRGNIEQLHDMAQELDTPAVVPVSSPDHAPRLLRDWNSYLDEDDDDFWVAVVGSDMPYAASGKEPFIVEAAMYEEFVDAFNEVWAVEEQHYEEAAQEVKQVLQKYHPE